MQCLYGILVAALLLWSRPPYLASVLAMLTVIILLSAELANSALERVVDLLSPEANARAGEAKDMAAGAVMLVSFASAVTVLTILFFSMEMEAFLGVGGLFVWLMVNRIWGGTRR